jgi:hypothetical protein
VTRPFKLPPDRETEFAAWWRDPRATIVALAREFDMHTDTVRLTALRLGLPRRPDLWRSMGLTHCDPRWVTRSWKEEAA